ncbi:magnesium/cobalt transporter CorA [Streptomyces fuscigenes]|uniref:magnesium/cobalt transporter CorA n=1 Tax=Streptomyces fuscigenes TaxID=1528880 RepID=UPI001F4051DF|nr:magnesium/cobalt transporter CorA [Streptomyces fuscigenes]MCF3964497.1 magnesium/cobalt transporter CorA [Streptomyces fuscigenes]
MPRVIVDCAIYRNGRRTEGPEDFSDALDEARASGDAFLWIGLHEPSEKEFSLVTSEFGLHPLAVEDALTAHQRPKLEVYDDSLFVVLKPASYEAETDTVTTDELMVFIGDSFVVTVRHGEGAALSAVRNRLESEPEILRRGPTAVLYAVSDAVVDHYIEVADELQMDLEEVEAEVFTPTSDSRASERASNAQTTAARIYNFKRQVLEFRRATGPLATPMQKLAGAGVPFVDAKSQPFFRDVNDHLTHANEMVEGLDRLLTDILSAHLAQMGVRQNDDMRKISAWAAMAAVPTMVAGIYGMNFEHMPELHWIWSYPTVIALMLAIVVGLHRQFKRRGWL